MAPKKNAAKKRTPKRPRLESTVLKIAEECLRQQARIEKLEANETVLARSLVWHVKESDAMRQQLYTLVSDKIAADVAKAKRSAPRKGVKRAG